MKEATYRVIYFPVCKRYVGMCWNYEQAVLIGTSDHASYTDARQELDNLCKERNVKLKFFDGNYTCEEGFLFPGDPGDFPK